MTLRAFGKRMKNNAEGFGIRESRPGHHVIYHAEEASQKASQMMQMYLGGEDPDTSDA